MSFCRLYNFRITLSLAHGGQSISLINKDTEFVTYATADKIQMIRIGIIRLIWVSDMWPVLIIMTILKTHQVTDREPSPVL